MQHTLIVADAPNAGAVVGYCAEVENVLADPPAVSEVAVIGCPHGKWGEVPMAVAAISAPGLALEDLKEFPTERLARYKQPRALAIIDTLPRNPAERVLKTALRQRFHTLGGRLDNRAVSTNQP